MTKFIFGRVVVRGGVGSEPPPEGCTSAGWRPHVCRLLSGCTSGRGCPAARKVYIPLYFCPPPPPIMWDDVSPENSKLLIYSKVLGVPIELKTTGGGEHSFVPPKDLAFLCLCTLEEIRADHREARLLVRTPPPFNLQREQTWVCNDVQCFTLLPLGKNECSTDIWHFLASQPPFLIEYCKPIIPLAVGDKVCMLNACSCTLEVMDFV